MWSAPCRAPFFCLSTGFRRSQTAGTGLRAVVADRFDWATFHRFFAEALFLRRLWLFIDVGMAAVVVSLEIGGRGFAAQIAVHALIIAAKLAPYGFGVVVLSVGHGFPVKNEAGR